MSERVRGVDDGMFSQEDMKRVAVLFDNRGDRFYEPTLMFGAAMLAILLWGAYLLGPIMQGRYLDPFVCALPVLLVV